MKTKRLWVAALCLAAACGGERKQPGGAGDGSGDGSGSGAGGGSGSNGSGDNGCAQYNVHSELTIPEMLIVLDRSGSMAPQGNDRMTDRWGGSRTAVVDVTARYDDDIDFGLVTFPGPQAQSGAGLGGNNNGTGPNAALNCTPGSVNVQVGERHADDIADVLKPMGTAGFTPTAATLKATRGAIVGTGPSDQTVVPPKYIMLVTDGDPNCSGDLSGPLTGDRVAEQDAINEIASLRTDGVQTFVVGYQTGDTAFASVLDEMAVAGGTGDARHHSIETAEQLADTFAELVGRAISCSFQLARAISDPSYVLVTVAGKMRQLQNAADGWSLGPDMRTITLTGGACEAVQKGASFRVDVTCEPIIGI